MCDRFSLKFYNPIQKPLTNTIPLYIYASVNRKTEQVYLRPQVPKKENTHANPYTYIRICIHLKNK